MSTKDGNKVLLFRAPKENEVDQYAQVLTDGGFFPYSVPVLQFNYINVDRFSQYLGQCDEYAAVVFTSQRAVEAAAKALLLLEENERKHEEKKSRRCLEMPCYVVGSSTLELAESAGFLPIKTDAGNAEKLADFITKHLTFKDKPVLYPCGNLRKDTLSVKLKQAGFVLKELEVYETVKSPLIMKEVEDFIAKQGLPDYVVFFSPSGVQFTADLVACKLLPLCDLKVVAIGQTTEKELQDAGVLVHAVAKTPDPDGILCAINENSGHR